MLHKIIESGGERYLPFALSRLRALRLLALPYVEQRFNVDGVDIRVAIIGDQEYIKVGGGGVEYEFYTTEELTGLGGVPAGLTDFMVAGEITRVLSSGVSKPVYSTNKFLAADYPGLLNPLPIEGQTTLTKTAPAWNGQRMPEYVHWVRNDKAITGSSKLGWSVSSRCTSDLSRWFLRETNWYTNSLGFSGDVMYDVVPAYMAPNKRGAQKVPNDFNFDLPSSEQQRVYGRACVREVVDPLWGKRLFFVFTDSTSNFYVYPVEDVPGDIVYETPNGTLNRTNHFTKIAPPLPAWVATTSVGSYRTVRSPPSFTLNTGTQYAADGTTVLGTVPDCFKLGTPETVTPLVDIYRYLWSFNSTGTKAVAVVSTIPYNDPSGLQHLVGQPSYIKAVNAPTGYTLTPDQISFTGLVEMDIAITLTGAGVNDYTASVTLAQSYDGSVTNKFYAGASYAYGDKRLVSLGLAEDDLIVATLGITTSTNPTTVGATSGLWKTPVGIASIPAYVPPDSRLGPLNNVLARLHIGKLGATPVKSIDVVKGNLVHQISDVGIIDATGRILGWTKQFFMSVQYPFGSNPFTAVFAACLRSISMILSAQKDNITTGLSDYASYAMSFGTIVEGDIAVLDPAQFINTANPSGTRYDLPVNEAYIGIYKYVMTASNITEDYTGTSVAGVEGLLSAGMISSHPAGHNAFYLRAPRSGGSGLDRIEMKVGAKTKVLRHKNLFNSAFKQTRGYDWYTSTQPGNQGGFATFGVWATTPSVFTRLIL